MSLVYPVVPAPTGTSMMPDINDDQLELLFSGAGDQEESFCSQPSTSTSSSTPSTVVCLSSQEMSSQVPECDIARISFYLRCCVLGCDIMMNDDVNHNHNEILSTTLVDFTRATTLPLEYQNIIERLAFEDMTYSFSNLQMSGVIHIDHQNQALPPGVSTMFLSSNTPEFTLAMTRLYGNFVVHHPNLVLPQKIMICSLEWINEYYASPLERYVRRSFVATTTATTAAASADANTTPAFADDQDQLYHGWDHHHHDDIASEHATSSFITATTTSQKALHRQHENEYFDYGDYDKQQGAMMMDDEDIPMVTAVPIFDDDDDCCHSGDSSSSSPTTATTTTIKKKKEEEMDVVSSSLIIPGQKVKFVGLEMDEMNDAMGIVQERRNNRVIVEVADHQCDYSVRIENLMIVL